MLLGLQKRYYSSQKLSKNILGIEALLMNWRISKKRLNMSFKATFQNYLFECNFKSKKPNENNLHKSYAGIIHGRLVPESFQNECFNTLWAAAIYRNFNAMVDRKTWIYFPVYISYRPVFKKR